MIIPGSVFPLLLIIQRQLPASQGSHTWLTESYFSTESDIAMGTWSVLLVVVLQIPRVTQITHRLFIFSYCLKGNF